jgi:hypothetical protein
VREVTGCSGAPGWRRAARVRSPKGDERAPLRVRHVEVVSEGGDLQLRAS